MENKITNWSFKTEMEKSFLDYSLSVIISRALPDVKDGLKPVHRRILWAMHEGGNINSNPYRKSATTVGNVISSYHPHGDAAIYESMVRMAQDFTLRHVLIQGQGNFGSVDGDSAAAMRYTEAKLSKIATYMLEDIRKDTVSWVDNYDGTTKQPVVLPSKFPNVLVNGAEGIAVGMATSIPTHNLVEVINAIKEIILDENISIKDICEIISAPDFPTSAYIMGKKGIIQAYETGRGSVRIRAKANISGDNSRIIIKEIPYQVNKSKLVEKIAELSNPKFEEPVLSKIRTIRDESDRDGIRVVIELKKDANAELVLSHLYKKTQLEVNHGINMVVLVNGVPKQLNIKEILCYYLEHQRDVVIRRTKFELKKAQKREHLISGFLRALDIIDAIVKTIRQSKNKDDAQKNLVKEFDFSQIQAQAIVEMQLYRLTGLEKSRLQEEYDEIVKLIESLKQILGSSQKVDEIIVEKFDEIALKFGEDRKTQILDYNEDGVDEDLIPQNDLILTLTSNMYLKTTLESEFNVQNRAGKGSFSQKIYEDDEIEQAINVNSHSNLLFFTSYNKVYRSKAYNIGVSNKNTRGNAALNFINLEPEEKIMKIVEVPMNVSTGYIVFVTKNGKIKKTRVEEYDRINKNGKKYSNYVDDVLADVFFAQEEEFVQIVASSNRAITFGLDQIRPMSRIANGVRAIRLGENDVVTSATPIVLDGYILTISEKGYGKLTKITNTKINSEGVVINKGFSPKNRGGKGLLASKLDTKGGNVIFNKCVKESDFENTFILLMTNTGKTLKIKLSDVSIVSRSSRGNIIQRLSSDEYIKAVTLSKEKDEAI